MGRGKQNKFADNDANEHIIQQGKVWYETIKGKWNSYFQNDNPIVLELACGRGEYTTGLAPHYPDKNFVGVDIKGARIWTGAEIAKREGWKHVAFLRTHIQNLADFFEPGEVAEIWLVHPDPRPKDSDERRRITNNRFLDMYKSLVQPGGILRLKTDNAGLYTYTLETLRERDDVKILDHTSDLYTSAMLQEHHDIKTRYEEEFTAEGHNITCIKFIFSS